MPYHLESPSLSVLIAGQISTVAASFCSHGSWTTASLPRSDETVQSRNRRPEFARWRWAWTLLSLAIFLMTLRRCVTLRYLLVGSGFVGFEEGDDFPISDFSAMLSLAVSLLVVGGVALIEPVFRKMVIAEALLGAEKEQIGRDLRQDEEELQIARQIQHKLFPQSPPDVVGFDIDGLWRAPLRR